ncbi:hypothetical protein [Ancylobacter terrae]|uniref:hypothetical protein n=1 Tax=Ancylobacter sp. sgz301288 TaxID=3342077 RepID=UPI00385876AC
MGVGFFGQVDSHFKLVHKVLCSLYKFWSFVVSSERIKAATFNEFGENVAACPFHSGSDNMRSWVQQDLLCSAGKREFRFGRYHVAVIQNGRDLAGELDSFRAAVHGHRRTGLLAILDDGGRAFANSTDELTALGVTLFEAGLCDDPARVVDGETIAIPIETVCPVLDRPVTFSFFPVAFCRNAGNEADELYDPSLSTPFTAINITSDAFAFALLVQDQARRLYKCAPHEIGSRERCEHLFETSIQTWNQMSANTITGYGKRSACPSRTVRLSEDGLSWYAPHNDPVFAERRKQMHSHEMPIIYCRRLCDTWLAALFDGGEAVIGREGQSGGIFVE